MIYGIKQLHNFISKILFSDFYYEFLNTILNSLKTNKTNPNINISITKYINESYITYIKKVENLEHILV